MLETTASSSGQRGNIQGKGRRNKGEIQGKCQHLGCQLTDATSQTYESQITLISSNLPVQRLTRAHWLVNTLGQLHYNSILMITDHDCTKVVILILCNEAIMAKGVAKLYLEHMLKRVGLPKTFIHDWDTWFMSHFAVKMCQVLGIKQNTSTVFHPWTDGQAEWTNQ